MNNDVELIAFELILKKALKGFDYSFKRYQPGQLDIGLQVCIDSKAARKRIMIEYRWSTIFRIARYTSDVQLLVADKIRAEVMVEIKSQNPAFQIAH